MAKFIAAALSGEIIALIVIGVIVVAATVYIVKAKKSGKKCIGCPGGCSCETGKKEKPSCGGNCSSCGGCSCGENDGQK